MPHIPTVGLNAALIDPNNPDRYGGITTGNRLLVQDDGSAGGGTTTINGGTITVSAGTVSLLSVKGALTDRGGSIAAGGTSQTGVAANAARQYLLLQNPISVTEALYVNFDGVPAPLTGTGSINTAVELAPGGSLEYTAPGYIPTGSVTVNAITTAHKYIAKEA